MMLKKSICAIFVLWCAESEKIPYSGYPLANELFYLTYHDPQFEDKIIEISNKIAGNTALARIRIKEALEITLRVFACYQPLSKNLKDTLDKLKLVNKPEQLCAFTNDLKILKDTNIESMLYSYLDSIKQFFIMNSEVVIPDRKQYNLLLEQLFTLLVTKTLKELFAQPESLPNALLKKVTPAELRDMLETLQEQWDTASGDKSQLISKINLLKKYIPQEIQAIPFQPFVRDLEQLSLILGK